MSAAFSMVPEVSGSTLIATVRRSFSSSAR